MKVNGIMKLNVGICYVMLGKCFGRLEQEETNNRQVYGVFIYLGGLSMTTRVLFEEQNVRTRRAGRAQRACSAPGSVSVARRTRAGVPVRLSCA